MVNIFFVDLYRGYSLGWDNVQKGVHRKHQTSTESSNFLLQATCYAIGHRTPSMALDDKDTIQCADIDPSAFIPTAADWNDVRDRMIKIVKVVLTDFVPALKTLHDNVDQIEHIYSIEMSHKRCVLHFLEIFCYLDFHYC
jgi:hypothetical protein